MLEKMSAATTTNMATSPASKDPQVGKQIAGKESLMVLNQQIISQKAVNGGDCKNLIRQLIESKFEQLAKRALEEFEQVHYSRDFFLALDEILGEPTVKSFAHTKRCIRSSKHLSNKYQNIQRQSQLARQQAAASAAIDSISEQPRSLPVEVVSSHHTNGQRHQQQQVSALVSSQKQKQQQQQQQPGAGHKSAIPIITGLSSPKKSPNQHTIGAINPICKSATIGDANNLDRQLANSKKHILEEQSLYKKQKNFSASNILANNAKQALSALNNQRERRNENDHNYENGDDDDFDAEDDDDDDDDDEDDDYLSSDVKLRNQMLLNQRFSQQTIAKPAKVSTNKKNDTTTISEMNLSNRHQPASNQQAAVATVIRKQQQSQPQPQPQPQQQQQQLFQVQKQRQRFNPIVRSNTISDASHKAANETRALYNGDLISSQQDYSQEPKSMILSSKDIGSLYKPHMNYSTSVLGNHRLSDDDEVIIIPTHSPSLLSTSPDVDGANVDELTERFSISRTKSFWEKLSKGNNGKRSANGEQTTASATGTTIDGLQRTNQQANFGHKSLTSSRTNEGHSSTLDRMDSTGGSNSNYSCSSSGDENGGGGGGGGGGSSGARSHQNHPTISQLQEMNRQNRFRQTR